MSRIEDANDLCSTPMGWSVHPEVSPAPSSGDGGWLGHVTIQTMQAYPTLVRSWSTEACIGSR